MKGRDVLRIILDREGITNAEYARLLGITQAALWDRLNTKKAKDIPVSTLSEMCNVLGYKVVVVPGTEDVLGFEVK